MLDFLFAVSKYSVQNDSNVFSSEYVENLYFESIITQIRKKTGAKIDVQHNSSASFFATPISVICGFPINPKDEDEVQAKQQFDFPSFCIRFPRGKSNLKVLKTNETRINPIKEIES